jgi:hypothetical protein
MYSVLSFVPAQGATSDSNGVYGYVAVKGWTRTPSEADELRTEFIVTGDGTESINVVFGDQFIECTGSEVSTSYPPEFIKQQIRVNVEIIEYLSENVKRLRSELDKPFADGEFVEEEDGLYGESVSANQDFDEAAAKEGFESVKDELLEKVSKTDGSSSDDDDTELIR